MTQTALALMMLVVAGRSVQAADVPRANLDSAPPPVAAMINEAALTVEASPSSAEAWGDYAMVLHAHACKPEADIAYAEAQRLAPSEFRWPYFRGVLQMKLDPSKALEHFDVAIELDGAYGPAYIWRGLALEMVGRDDDDARRDYLQAIRLQPSNASAHLHLGQLEMKQGKIDDAIGHLERARKARPDNSAVLSSLARAYTRAGDRIRARELADAARKTNAGARRVVGDHRFNEVAGRAVTLQSFVARANVYLKAGQSDRALAELQRALSHYPDAGKVHESLARLYLSRREYGKCVRSSRIALASGRTSASLSTVLAAGLLSLGEFDEAEIAVHAALEESPAVVEGLRVYGKIAAARGDDV
ncbi:MAG: tetratricopeptide repeat protein, partial [Planctomycetota bacterium]|nr:tetratricopeptide repeat protein [Planctomycetota bacterium]